MILHFSGHGLPSKNKDLTNWENLIHKGNGNLLVFENNIGLWDLVGE